MQKAPYAPLTVKPKTMKLHLLPLLLLLFFSLVGIEYWLTSRKKQPNFRFDITLLNISCGIIERSIDVLFIGVMYFLFDFIYQNFALFDISRTWYNWILALIAVDFMVYWYHRSAHEVNIFWGAHVTHHSSEDFNLTVAFRNSSFPMIIKTKFYAVVALIGFPPEMIVGAFVVSGIYQFFQHTTVIGKLGFLEYILATPSAHRVHHGSNEQYLDKNYGGVFIIWDRIFGTYEPETEPVRYGITRPFRTVNPIYAYFHFWMELFKASKTLPGFREKIKLWLGRPIDFPKINLVSKQEFREMPHLPKKLQGYILTQMVLNVLCIFSIMIFKENFSTATKFWIVAMMVLSSFTVNMLAGKVPWAYYLEFVRMILILGMIPIGLQVLELKIAFLVVSVGSVLWLAVLRKYFVGEVKSRTAKNISLAD